MKEETRKSKVSDMMQPGLSEQPFDFSPVIGGPIFQLLRKAHLAGDALELLRRRVLIITMTAWLPLFLISTFGSSLWNAAGLSFFRDVEVQARFLVALPVLVGAELIVHSRIREPCKVL